VRYAVISDIHGNLEALNAVLLDMKSKNIDKIICIGDISNAGPFPRQCFDLVYKVSDYLIRGNHELYSLGVRSEDNSESSARWSSLNWCNDELGKENIKILKNLKDNLVIKELSDIEFFHASPLTEFNGFNTYSDNFKIKELLKGFERKYLIAGHTHESFIKKAKNTTIVNPGSVGMSFNGVNANYLIIEKTDVYSFSLQSVSYDYKKAIYDYKDTMVLKDKGHISKIFAYQLSDTEPMVMTFIKEVQKYANDRNLSYDQAYLEFPFDKYFSYVSDYLNQIWN